MRHVVWLQRTRTLPLCNREQRALAAPQMCWRHRARRKRRIWGGRVVALMGEENWRHDVVTQGARVLSTTADRWSGYMYFGSSVLLHIISALLQSSISLYLVYLYLFNIMQYARWASYRIWVSRGRLGKYCFGLGGIVVMLTAFGVRFSNYLRPNVERMNVADDSVYLQPVRRLYIISMRCDCNAIRTRTMRNERIP